MSNLQIILNGLECNYTQYGNFRERMYSCWCFLKASKYHCSVVMFSENEMLKSWYRAQWLTKVEQRFVLETNDYRLTEILDVELANLILHEIAVDLEYTEPKNLIREILKQKQKV